MTKLGGEWWYYARAPVVFMAVFVAVFVAVFAVVQCHLCAFFTA